MSEIFPNEGQYQSPSNQYFENAEFDDGFGEEDDYDDQKEQRQQPKGVMGIAANALGSGFGDAMGLEEDQVDELTAMELEMLQGNVAGEAPIDTKIKIRVFINMDEDDNNQKNIDLNHIFKRTDLEKPFYVDVSHLISFIVYYLIASNFRPFQLQRIDT